ncbi:uncharacterized protein BYT42DRAFT_610659 [Radiomyces spectabilis]|uniref:uncharacterized protein n=1 Tax=Radiomyces spectabilis TaxID=64574 RepID=UPI00221E38AA|nr:uncharacterized protein BYT42DRAFT_610659 [Radiomyces spectabilis]KAI8391425.1 hypothetical protein BYT42DRAFT_610659 [Radiomyces spectabilis]
MTLDDPYKVVIAYDFGTTFSGASYAFAHNTPEIYDVQKWPHKNGSYYPKVPTLSVYKRSNPKHLLEWGHAAKKIMLKPQSTEHNILLSNFKLSLDEHLREGALENGISPVEAIAHYLGALHQHVLDDVTRGFAKNYHPDTFRYCLTVPAMWSDRAKHTMRQAALKANLIRATDPEDRLVLISEPEAAALYCEKMCDQINLRPGNRIMICDAGGGTVDLIVFEITDASANGIKNDRLKEVTHGMGESCGSVFIDRHFQSFLQRKLGDQSIPPLAMNMMMDQFVDNIKPEFDGLEDHYLNLPASLSLDPPEDECLDEGTLILRAGELQKQVFDPVVEKVLDLMERQYRQITDHRLDCIFLVGGFGSSNYLYQCVQDRFELRVGQILCPPRAAMAVVRGAVLFGLNPRVIVSRVSRRTYGINAGLPFVESVDPPESRVIRPDGSMRCITRFLPFVTKDDEFPIDHFIAEEMFVYYGTVASTDIMLYATENDRVPRYVNEEGLEQVASITVPVPTIPGVGHGERISYIVRMFFGTTEIRMEADFGTGRTYKVYCDFDAVNKYASTQQENA